MDLDAIGWIAWLLHQWRAALCLAASSGLAVILVGSFTWLNELQGLAIAASGLIPAMRWHSISTEPAPQSPAPTPLSVAALAAALAGAAWGIISAASMHSFLAGLALLVLAAWGWSWLQRRADPAIDKGRIRLCIGLAGLAYPLSALVAHPLF